MPSGLRWLSTIHLMGAGYWVWLIPLGSGSTSFGIVADGDLHPFTRINRFERAMDWLREFEPQCAAVDGGARRRARGLSRAAALRARLRAGLLAPIAGRWSARPACSPIRSIRPAPTSSRWATTTSTDLIVRDARGEDIAARAEAFNTTYLRLFDAFIRLYDGQYPIMGNAQVMTAKVAWDNACYWAITALLFFQRRLRQPEFMASIDPLMRRFFVLHARMQQFFRAWDRADAGAIYAAAAPNVVDVELLRRAAGQPRRPDAMDDDALASGWTTNFALLEAFARTLAGDGAPSGIPRCARVRLRRAAAAPVDAARHRVALRLTAIADR